MPFNFDLVKQNRCGKLYINKDKLSVRKLADTKYSFKPGNCNPAVSYGAMQII
jgi:hypothetical protein